MAGRVAVPNAAEAVASIRRPIPITDTSRRGNYVYAALSVALLVVVATVAVEWQRERTAAARLSFVPAARMPQVPAEPQRFASAAVDVSPSNLTSLPVAEAAAPPLVTAAAPPLVTAAAPPVVMAKAPAIEGNRRIVFRFERESWVEVRGRDGKTLLSQLNPAGSEQAVEGRPPFTLVIGNAQHVRLSYEDRQIDLAPHVKVEVARFTLE